MDAAPERSRAKDGRYPTILLFPIPQAGRNLTLRSGAGRGLWWRATYDIDSAAVLTIPACRPRREGHRVRFLAPCFHHPVLFPQRGTDQRLLLGAQRDLRSSRPGRSTRGTPYHREAHDDTI